MLCRHGHRSYEMFHRQVIARRYCDLRRNAVQFSWIVPQLSQRCVQFSSQLMRLKPSRLSVSLLLGFQIGPAWRFSPVITMNPRTHGMLVSFAHTLEASTASAAGLFGENADYKQFPPPNSTLCHHSVQSYAPHGLQRYATSKERGIVFDVIRAKGANA